MRIDKEYKPSFHKANARYRGVTEHSQYTNFVLESAHDLMLLANITKGNERNNIDGHEKELYDNFVSIMTGDQGVGRSNVFTASTLQKINRARLVPVPGLGNWSPLNGCTRTAAGAGYKLASSGLLDPVGMYTTLYVEPGDKVYIRLKVRSSTGASDFTFGSNNMRTGPDSNGDTKKVPLSTSSSFKTVDYILRFQYAESIHLSINVNQNPGTLRAGEVEIKDLEIFYIDESPIQASSFDKIIKPNVDELEEKINSIR